ncbi:MAG: hypothetical protein RL145_1235 [Pseudomonadota bacterium]
MAEPTPMDGEQDGFDAQLEVAATAWLSGRRGKPVWSGPPPVARLIANLVPPDQRKAGMTARELQGRWAEIVGDKIATICQPDQIKGETLVLKVVAAAAPLLSMRATEIVGLVRLAGASKIKKLSLVRAPLKQAIKAPVKATNRKLNATEQRKLDEQLEQVTQPSLKAALTRLAEATASID